MDQQIADDTLMSLAEFRATLRMSPSAERNKRREGNGWPRHLVLGRKVFYRRSAVRAWLECQEAKQVDAR